MPTDWWSVYYDVGSSRGRFATLRTSAVFSVKKDAVAYIKRMSRGEYYGKYVFFLGRVAPETLKFREMLQGGYYKGVKRTSDWVRSHFAERN